MSPSHLVGLLVDAEWLYRENKKLSSRLQHARLRQPASLEELDYSHARGPSKPQVLELATCRWVADKQNVLLTGPTGVGKRFLACAPGHKACREGSSVVYRRASRLFDELAQARADGTYLHLHKRLAKAQVLILDDFGLEPLGAAERKELLEVLEDRYQQSATVVTSLSLPPRGAHAGGDAAGRRLQPGSGGAGGSRFLRPAVHLEGALARLDSCSWIEPTKTEPCSPPPRRRAGSCLVLPSHAGSCSCSPCLRVSARHLNSRASSRGYSIGFAHLHCPL